MPPKKNSPSPASQQQQQQQQDHQGLKRIVANESLLATDDERQHTSASLYNDHSARIMSNIGTIRDRLRISAYTAAFNHSTVDKNVLFLGCGIGLLPMICARAGAKSVVAVDSSSIVQIAKAIADTNQLKNITFVTGVLRDGNVVLPIEKFDAIVCEWMGSFITNDQDYQDLEYAIKNHLAEGGMILPNRAQLHAVALSDYNYRADMLDYWDNVYGFQMHPMRDLVLHEASTGHIPRNCIVSRPVMVHQVEFPTPSADASVSVESLLKNFADSSRKYTADFQITVDRKCSIHFLTFYLSSTFTDKIKPRGNFILSFSMGEHGAFTEVSLTLPEPLPVFEKDVIEGTLSVNPLRHQHTEIELTCRVKNAAVTVDGATDGLKVSQKYLFQY